MTDVDYADDMALPANTLTRAKFQLNSLEQAAESIGLYVNANKTNKKEPSPLKMTNL